MPVLSEQYSYFFVRKDCLARAHGAPAKKLHRNVRELTTSRPPPAKLSVRTDRVRSRTKKMCEKWTLTAIHCNSVSVHFLHVGKGLAFEGVQFQGRSSPSLVIGWPLDTRSRTSLR